MADDKKVFEEILKCFEDLQAQGFSDEQIQAATDKALKRSQGAITIEDVLPALRGKGHKI